MSAKTFTRILLVGVTAIGLLPVAAVAQEPRAEFTLVKHDQRVVRDGREGLLITFNARLVKLQDRQVRFAAFFDVDKKPLKAKTEGFRAGDGTLTVQRAEFPKIETVELNGLQLFLPYEELDLSRRAPNEVRYFVEIQNVLKPGKASFLANSGNFFFTFPPSESSPAVAGDVSGRWNGTEDLQGYGDLTFEFEAGGVSFMTDKDGRRQGTWSRQGNEVSLAFYNGTVVYRGNLSGTSMSGTVTSGNRTWNWRASQQGATPPPPPAVAGAIGRWVGTEDLKGYGDLLMEIEQNGVVFMTDKDGRRQGSWEQHGNEIALGFYNGSVVYRGVLTDSKIAGAATSGKMTWNWQTTRQGGTPVVSVPPVTTPSPTPPPPTKISPFGRWVGTEELQGYGNLVMEIEQNGVAFMTDKDGRRQGTWNQEGNQLTLAFYDGAVVYRGNLTETSIAGAVSSGPRTWNWRATREGFRPSTPSVPSAPPIAAGILGRWSGSEDLQGYGDLVIEIEQNGVAFMSDKDGRRQGTWTQQTNEVALAFYDGTVVYRGTLSGATLSGVATNGKTQWNWRITRGQDAPPIRGAGADLRVDMPMTSSLSAPLRGTKPNVAPAPAKFIAGKFDRTSKFVALPSARRAKP